MTTPRAIFSTDTATAAPGTLELQVGGVYATNRFFDVPVQLNVGAGRRTEVFFGISPYQSVRSASGVESGVANLFLGARRRVLEETAGRPSVAVQGFVKFPTRKLPDELGTGKVDYALAGTATRTIDGHELTGYYELSLLGGADGGFNLGHLMAIQTTPKLIGRWGFHGELAGSFVPASEFEAGFLTLGATYNPRAATVIDCGVTLGIGADAPRLTLFLGLSDVLAQLWAPRS